MAYRSSSTNSGSSATPSVAVPAGVAADDIVILVCAIDDQTADFETADWPTGFTELHDVNLTLDGHSAAVGWKRLTGADSGSYTFGSLGASADWVCQAAAFSGRHTGNPPVASTAATNNSANTSPITVTANGVTAVAGDDLLWASAPDVTSSGAGNGHDAPTNFTERQDAENLWANLSIATRDNVSAGATGNITGTFNLSQDVSGWAAFLVRIPVAGGQTFNITPSGSIAPVGALLKQNQKTLAGSTTPTGAFLKTTQKAFSGSAIPTGTLSTIKVILRTFAGSIAPSGALARGVGKSLGGSIAPVGALAKAVGKLFSGILTLAGSVINFGAGAPATKVTATISDRILTSASLGDSRLIKAGLSDLAVTKTTLGDATVTGATLSDSALTVCAVSDGIGG